MNGLEITEGQFSDAARQAVYDVIARRRDIRVFTPNLKIPPETLTRILGAAHQAPSVGFAQPWDFVVVNDIGRRQRIRESFLKCREAEAQRFSPERRASYLAFRLEGILESSLNLCVTADLRPSEEGFVGATSQPEALRWSVCCAVENLWLAARAEGIGVGWVSIVEPTVLRSEFGLPPGIEPVAYLCLGYPKSFGARPELEEAGWRGRRPLVDVLHDELYRSNKPPAQPRLPVPLRNRTPEALPKIPQFDEAAESAAKAYQLRLTKPPHSLGRLEQLATWYAGVRGRFPIEVPAVTELAVFAGDHGVTVEGVSAYPSSVTPAMVANFLAGGAAVNALSRRCGVTLTVVDVGVAGDLTALPTPRGVRYVSAKVRAGTANMLREPAMFREEAMAALGVGLDVAADAVLRADVLAVGEMGIGNTTAAAAVCAALTGIPPEELVGAGTGLDERGIARKVQVVREALALHRPLSEDPVGVLAAVGGLEIAAMAGFMIGVAAARRPILVDGFISTSAALVAVALRPAVKPYLCLSHLSAERGHRCICESLGLTPLLDLGLRLGEGTGAVLAAHLLTTAIEAQVCMATFSTAGVPDRLERSWERP